MARELLLVPTVTLRRTWLVMAVTALGIGFGCSSQLDDRACSADSDCASGAYCMGFSRQCVGATYAYTVGVGTCHRDCSTGACACLERADCRPWGECYAGRCVALPISCLEEPSTCPTGCTLGQASDSVCGPVCRCAVCPAADAGLDTAADH